MFTKNIWHNCAHCAGSRPRPVLPVKREGGLFVWFNESILQRAMGPWCNARNSMVSIVVMSYTRGFNHDPWPLILSQTACTVLRRESCSAAWLGRCSPLYTCTVQLYTRPARTGRGRTVQFVHRAQSCRTVPAVRRVITVKSESRSDPEITAAHH